MDLGNLPYMERRTILLGSGAALATVLAGCIGSDENGDEPDEESATTDDGEVDDIPGYDNDELEPTLEDHDISIDRAKHDGDELHVEYTASESDFEDLEDTFESISDSVAKGVKDPEKFAAEIRIVYVTIYDSAGDELASFYIEVQWAVDYMNGDLTEEAFIDKVSETA